MSISYPILGDLWPFTEAAAAPELASLPLDVFFNPAKDSSVTAASWVTPVDPAAAPRAAYAIRVRQAGGQGELARWDPIASTWVPVRRFAVPDRGERCSIVELNGILLGGVQNAEMLETRLKSLMAKPLREAKALRLTARVLSVMSVIVLFYAVRSGVEAKAIEPFALIFALAVGIGLLAAGLRNRTKTLSEQALLWTREQFQFEYRKADHPELSLTQATGILQENARKREEGAVIFGFLLLLCFVYFVSPLVVVGVIVALIVVAMISGDQTMLRVLGIAYDRAESRLEHAFLSFRASDDALAPPALRQAKREVLRDRIRRYGDMAGRVHDGQARFRLTQDIAVAVAFGIIFSAYAFPIAAGFQRLPITGADSLVTTSLFKVAPVIILLSISKSTFALAQVLNRRMSKLLK